MIERRREAVLDGYKLTIGAFLFVSPWLAASTHGNMGRDAWIVGALIAVISFAALIAFTEWQEWIVLALGAWLAASPWILGFQSATAMKINVGAGLLIIYLAALELYLIHFPPSPEPHH